MIKDVANSGKTGSRFFRQELYVGFTRKRSQDLQSSDSMVHRLSGCGCLLGYDEGKETGAGDS